MIIHMRQRWSTRQRTWACAAVAAAAVLPWLLIAGAASSPASEPEATRPVAAPVAPVAAVRTVPAPLPAAAPPQPASVRPPAVAPLVPAPAPAALPIAIEAPVPLLPQVPSPADPEPEN